MAPPDHHPGGRSGPGRRSAKPPGRSPPSTAAPRESDPGPAYLFPALYDGGVCREAAQAAEHSLPGVRIIQDRPLLPGRRQLCRIQPGGPRAYAYLGTGNPDRPETMNPAHNGKFDIEESTLAIGAALYAAYAQWWLAQEAAADENTPPALPVFRNMTAAPPPCKRPEFSLRPGGNSPEVLRASPSTAWTASMTRASAAKPAPPPPP